MIIRFLTVVVLTNILSDSSVTESFYSYLLIISLKLFSTNVPLLYPLKTSENLHSSDVFMGYREEILIKMGKFAFSCTMG